MSVKKTLAVWALVSASLTVAARFGVEKLIEYSDRVHYAPIYSHLVARSQFYSDVANAAENSTAENLQPLIQKLGPVSPCANMAKAIIEVTSGPQSDKEIVRIYKILFQNCLAENAKPPPTPEQRLEVIRHNGGSPFAWGLSGFLSVWLGAFIVAFPKLRKVSAAASPKTAPQPS